MISKKTSDLISKLKAENEYGWQLPLKIFEYIKFVQKFPGIFNEWRDAYTQKEFFKYVLNEHISFDNLFITAELNSFKKTTASVFENESLVQELQKYDKEVLFETLNYLLNNNSPFKEVSNTPKSIVDLVIDNYFQEKKDTFLDVCSGTGVMLNEAIDKNVSDYYLGIEINNENFVITLIKLELQESTNYHIINADVFDDKHYINEKNIKADYIFCNYPFGLLNNNNEILMNFGSKTSKSNFKTRRKDYQFISYVYDHLKLDGKGVIVVSGNILFNAIDTDIRKYLVENYLIESVVALPENLLDNISIPVYLLIVGFNKNTIKMVDLTNVKNNKRRDKNDIDLVLANSLIKNGNLDFSREVSLEELKKEQYSLIPGLYLRKDKFNFKNMTSLENVAEVFSGWQVSSQILDKIYEPNPIKDGLTQIVQISDIDEGFLEINNNFYNVDKKYIDRFRVQKNDVVISTKSQYVKSAVIDEDIKFDTIASGSIIVIRPNKELIDSNYLKAFLESQIGQQLLSMRMTGNVIKNLTVNNVKSLDVPLVSIEVQKNIGNSFIQKKQLIKVQKNRINKLSQEADALFDFLTEGGNDDI